MENPYQFDQLDYNKYILSKKHTNTDFNNKKTINLKTKIDKIDNINNIQSNKRYMDFVYEFKKKAKII